MRQRALTRAQIGMGQEEVMAKEDEKSASEAEEDLEETTEEETTDSEGEEGARLKPVFVRKKDRLTVQEREREEAKLRLAEREAQASAEQRRRDTLRYFLLQPSKVLGILGSFLPASSKSSKGLLFTLLFLLLLG
jgi:microfibrillar-associated protein 1